MVSPQRLSEPQLSTESGVHGSLVVSQDWDSARKAQ